MDVRLIGHPQDTESWASEFNTHAVSPAEIIVCYRDGQDSVYMKDLEVKLEKGWTPMVQAFIDHDIITDNYNRTFFEPRNAKERERGYSL